jgi:hypothetical protein
MSTAGMEIAYDRFETALMEVRMFPNAEISWVHLRLALEYVQGEIREEARRYSVMAGQRQ